MKKVAILSHVLPPSGSGQALVLHKFLRKIPPEQYCLLTFSKPISPHTPPASSPLPKQTCFLKANCVSSHLLSGRPKIVHALFLANVIFRGIQLVRILQQAGASILVPCSGDLLDFPAAYFAALRLKNLRLIPYLFDDYVFQWFGWERKLAHGIASVLMKRASRVLVPNEFLAEAYRSRFGISTVIVRNPSEPFRAERGKEKPFLPRSGIRIVYTGAVYHAHYDALANVAKAVESMEDSEITLHIFSQQSKAMIEAHGIKGSRVFIHPHVDHAKIEQVFSEATILLLPLAFQSPIPEVIRTSAPGKMGEYLLSGKPILVHAPSDCFISWFFQHHQCGTVAPRNNVEDLKRSIREIGHDPEKTGRLLLKAQSVGQQEFSLEVNLNRFLTAISEK